MQVYSTIFEESGFFFIVDIFRLKFPNLPEEIVTSVFDEWREVYKPVDPRLDVMSEKFDITMQEFFERLSKEDDEDQEQP